MRAGAHLRIAVVTLPKQILESLFPMSNMVDTISYTMVLETTHHQLCMILIIFN
jgi:hypothetical protein